MNIQQHGGFLMAETKDVGAYANRAAGKSPGAVNINIIQIGGKRIVSTRKRSEI